MMDVGVGVLLMAVVYVVVGMNGAKMKVIIRWLQVMVVTANGCDM